MTQPRFILAAEKIQSATICLTGTDLRHFRSLRLQAGDRLLIADGQGREFYARVMTCHPYRVELECLEATDRKTEPLLNITLYQGLTKQDKWEWVIQKTTELGVSALVPMWTARSQILPRPDSDAKWQRWQTIARQAAQQSGRLCVPLISPPRYFSQCLSDATKNHHALLLYEAGEGIDRWKQNKLSHLSLENLAIMVGPEGGFTPQEVQLAQAAGLQVISLGPRILRSETAGIVAVALALFTWGDLG